MYTIFCRTYVYIFHSVTLDTIPSYFLDIYLNVGVGEHFCFDISAPLEISLQQCSCCHRRECILFDAMTQVNVIMRVLIVHVDQINTILIFFCSRCPPKAIVHRFKLLFWPKGAIHSVFLAASASTCLIR